MTGYYITQSGSTPEFSGENFLVEMQGGLL